MSSPQIPNFTSIDEVLPYLARHRWELSMLSFSNYCNWAMDPDAVDRSAIRALIGPLPRVQVEELGPDITEKDCPVCLSEYGTASPTDTPIKLPCQHILGADCLFTWLMSGKNTCPHCRRQVFTRPTHLEFFSHQHLQLIEVRGAAMGFLAETSWHHDKSYLSFRRWANEHTDDATSRAYRRLALDAINTIETLARDSSRPPSIIVSD